MDTDIQYHLMAAPLWTVFPGHYDQERLNGTVYEYRAFIESMGFDIVIYFEAGDYAGDVLVLVRHGFHYGILAFSFGSCSGCDALQACSTHEELEALRQRFFESIKWGTACELLDYVEKRDWALNHEWYLPGCPEFVEDAKTLLRRVCAAT